MQTQTVTVVGAGTMGAGIAQAACQAGYRTHLVDADPAGLARGVARIVEFWDKGIARGKTTPAQKAEWLARLGSSLPLAAAAAQSGLCIEAVPEDLALKQRIFKALDAAAPKHAVLASNTSSLSIAAIAQATGRPGAVVGMHFFNPVPLMQLLEVVRHDGTSAATLQAAQEVGAAMGKTVITVRDSPGFATSRLGIVLGNEAMRMLAEGVASARDIDTAMRLGYGHPMGPLELSDLVGLDVRQSIGDYLHAQFGGDHYRTPKLVRDLVAKGELGKKTGKGIYDWSDGTPKERALR
ncbi:MAG TPA: 3-hydroxyacyl-CoA dehydrogenase family protein [Candidatus Thermoplasmatota archaeon]|nr:3-hydroxyacyl-CoA dehydrogenase family protein [Candidatus Thermoplasmatota archaeon]